MKKVFFVLMLMIGLFLLVSCVSASVDPYQSQMNLIGNQLEADSVTPTTFQSAGMIFGVNFRTNMSMTTTGASWYFTTAFGVWGGNTLRFGIQLLNVSGVPDGTWITSKNVTPATGWNSFTWDASKSLSDNTGYALICSDTGSKLNAGRYVAMNIVTTPYGVTRCRPSEDQGYLENKDMFIYKITAWTRNGYPLGWTVVDSTGKLHGCGYISLSGTFNVFTNNAYKQLIKNFTSATTIDGIDLYCLIPNNYLPTGSLAVELRYYSNDTILRTSYITAKNVSMGYAKWCRAPFTPATLSANRGHYIKVWSTTGSGAYYTIRIGNGTAGNTTSIQAGYGGSWARLYVSSNNGTSYTSTAPRDMQFRLHMVTPLTVTNSNTYVTGSSTSSYSLLTGWTVTNSFTSSVTTINSTTNATLVHQKAWTGSTWNVWGNASSGILTYENLVNTSGTHQKKWDSVLGKYKVWANYTTGILLYQNIVNASGNHVKAWDSVLGKFKVWANYTGSTTPIHTSDTKTNCTGSLGYVLNSTGYWVTSVHSSNLSLYENIVNSSGTHVKVWDGSKFKVWANYTTGILLYQNIVNASGTHQKVYSSALGKFKVWANYSGACGSTALTVNENNINVTGGYDSQYNATTGWNVTTSYIGDTTPIHTSDTKNNVTGSLNYTLNGTGYWVTSSHESTVTQFLNLINATGTHEKVWTGTTWNDWANVTGNTSAPGLYPNVTWMLLNATPDSTVTLNNMSFEEPLNTSIDLVLSEERRNHNMSIRIRDIDHDIIYVSEYINTSVLKHHFYGLYPSATLSNWTYNWSVRVIDYNTSEFLDKLSQFKTDSPTNINLVQNLGSGVTGTHEKGLYADGWTVWANYSAFIPSIRLPEANIYDPNPANNTYVDDFGNTSAGLMDNDIEYDVNGLNTSVYIKFKNVGVDTDMVQYAVNGSYGDGNYQFYDPWGVCSDGTYIWIVDRLNNRVIKRYAENLTYIANISGLGNFGDPVGIAVDDNYIYVADKTNENIKRFFKGNLNFDKQYNYLWQVSAVCVNDTYLWDFDLDHDWLVKRWKSNGTVQTYIGGTGCGNDQFNQAYGLCISPDNKYLFVADTFNHRIMKRWAGNLTYISESGNCGLPGLGQNEYQYPGGVACDESNVWITDSENHRIVKRNASTFAYIAESGEAGVAGTDANHYDAPIGIAHSVFSDYIWITEANNNRVNVRYDTSKSTINVSFWSNSSGSWQRYGNQRTTILTDSVVGQINKNFTGNNTQYWWMVSMQWGAIIKSYYNRTFTFNTTSVANVTGSVSLFENIVNASGTHVKAWDGSTWKVWANYTGNTTPIHTSDTKKNVTGSLSYILNGTGYWVTSVHESKLVQFLNLVNASGTNQKSWNGSVWLDWANVTGNASNVTINISGGVRYVPMKRSVSALMLLVPLTSVVLMGGLLGVRRRRRVQ